MQPRRLLAGRDDDQFNSNQNQNFFVIFRDQITNSDLKIARYFHEYGSNLDDIISSLEEETEDAINRVLEILQNRIDQFGVSEPTIQKQGKYRILVELAGIQDSVLKSLQTMYLIGVHTQLEEHNPHPNLNPRPQHYRIWPLCILSTISSPGSL